MPGINLSVIRKDIDFLDETNDTGLAVAIGVKDGRMVKVVGAGTGTVQGPVSSVVGNVPLWASTDGVFIDGGLAVGTAANNLVQLDGTGKLPAVDGSQLTNLPSGSGDVVGPASSTDSAVVLYDGTTGKLIKDGPVFGTAVGNVIALVDVGGGTPGLPAIDGSLLTGISGYGPWINEVETRIAQLEDLTPDVVLTTTGAPDLQTAVAGMTDGQVLEVRTHAVYDPIIIPPGLRLIIKAGKGYTPKITGAGAIQIQDGAGYCTISGFICDGDTLPGSDPHGRGCCISVDHQAKASHMIFHNITMTNISGSGVNAVIWSYHQSVSGDNYGTAPTLSEFSDHIAFVGCHTARASNSLTEGAHITIRGVDYLYMKDNYLDGRNPSGANDSRGIQIHDCTNVWIEGNTVLNFDNPDEPAANGEGIKIDEIGTMVGYRNTGVILKNRVMRCIEGIDVDDKCDYFVIDNEVSHCTDEGINLDDSATAQIMGNVVYHCDNGIRLEAGSIAELKLNNCFNNHTNNYYIQNGYTVDSTNGNYMERTPNVDRTSFVYEVVSEAGNEVTVTATGPGVTAAWNVSVSHQLDVSIPDDVDLIGITVVDTTRHDVFNNIIIDFGSRAIGTRSDSDAGRNISNETLVLPNCRMINAANGSNLNPAITANMANLGEFTFGNMTGGPTVLYATF